MYLYMYYFIPRGTFIVLRGTFFFSHVAHSHLSTWHTMSTSLLVAKAYATHRYTHTLASYFFFFFFCLCFLGGIHSCIGRPIGVIEKRQIFFRHVFFFTYAPSFFTILYIVPLFFFFDPLGPPLT